MSQPSKSDILVYMMVATSAADGQMSDSELKRIGSVVQTLPAFEGYGEEEFVSAVKASSDILNDEDGLDRLIDLGTSLPQRLQETAYALAVEVAASDLSVAAEEVRLLQLLRDNLDLDRLTTAAIERAAKARHQTL